MKLPIKHKDVMAMIKEGYENAMAGKGGAFSAMVFNSQTGELIAISSNSVLEDKDPTAHAEVNTIRRACKVLNKESLEGYSLLTSNEPCPMCASAIMWARLDAWYYIADSQTAAQIGFDDVEFYKRLQLLMRMKKVPSEYERLFKYDNPAALEEVKKAFQAYKDNNKEIY